MRLHYESNTPFLSATFVQKDIDVSHWGNVAVEVAYDHLINNGPKFTGPFSRWVFMVSADRIPSAIPTFAEHLPDGAHDIYYRDIIGNISTSALDRVSAKVG
jgi:dolichyl-diphosphooligosaccharide---protein glycosyltransferase subunit 1 (ribophorin I)